jgi:hypothetical protein
MFGPPPVDSPAPSGQNSTLSAVVGRVGPTTRARAASAAMPMPTEAHVARVRRFTPHRRTHRRNGGVARVTGSDPPNRWMHPRGTVRRRGRECRNVTRALPAAATGWNSGPLGAATRPGWLWGPSGGRYGLCMMRSLVIAATAAVIAGRLMMRSFPSVLLVASHSVWTSARALAGNRM